MFQSAQCHLWPPTQTQLAAPSASIAAQQHAQFGQTINCKANWSLYTVSLASNHPKIQKMDALWLKPCQI